MVAMSLLVGSTTICCRVGDFWAARALAEDQPLHRRSTLRCWVLNRSHRVVEAGRCRCCAAVGSRQAPSLLGPCHGRTAARRYLRRATQDALAKPIHCGSRHRLANLRPDYRSLLYTLLEVNVPQPQQQDTQLRRPPPHRRQRPLTVGCDLCDRCRRHGGRHRVQPGVDLSVGLGGVRRSIRPQ